MTGHLDLGAAFLLGLIAVPAGWSRLRRAALWITLMAYGIGVWAWVWERNGD